MVYTGHPRGRRGGNPLDDSIGNRKSHHEMQRNLPEDIGNRRSSEDAADDVPDDLGNRVGGPAPWSRQFLRGKGGKRGGRRSNAAYKDMEQLYAAQGEGVPRFLRPGFRALPSGELAAVQQDGTLRPTGQTITGERVAGSGGGGGSHAHAHDGQEGNHGAPNGGPQGDETLGDGEGRRKRRRRRKRGRDGVELGEGGGGQQGGGRPQQGQQGGQGGAQQHGHGHSQGHTGFEEDDEGFRYQLKSDPDVKRQSALNAVQEVLKHAGRTATVKATVFPEAFGPRVVVEIKEQDPQGPLFSRGTPALGAVTFLVNKIVNRYPDDRIRLSIVEEGTWVPLPVTLPAPAAAPAAPSTAAAPAAAQAAPAAAPAAAAPSAAPASVAPAAAAAPAPAAPAPSAERATPVPAPAPAKAGAVAEEEEDEDEEDDGDDEDGGDEEVAAASPEAGEAPKKKARATTRRTGAAAKKTTTRKKAAARRSPR
jgi:hypothetical protein